MPLLYKQIPLQTSGMVCARQFELPGDGRKILFDLSPGGSFRKDIFLMTDGKLQRGPFSNGSRIQSPVCGMERLLSSPHEAFAIVVDRTEVTLPPIALPLTSIPVIFASGREGTIQLRGTLYARIFPADSGMLARKFADGTVSDPCGTAAGCLKQAVLQAAATAIPAAMRKTTPLEATGLVPAIALEVAGLAVQETQRRLPWCRVSACEVELTVDNLTGIVEDTNFHTELTLEVKRKVLDAVLSTFGASPLPAEVAQVIQAYIQSNPGLPGSDIQDFCKCVNSLWTRGGANLLALAVSRAGLNPGKEVN